MTTGSPKASGAFRTIGELSRDTGLAQHILRYWETRFPQLRPVTRAGNRRYYRPDDVALVRRIDSLLNKQGYTVKGAQQLLAAELKVDTGPPAAIVTPAVRSTLIAIRDALARVLHDD